MRLIRIWNLRAFAVCLDAKTASVYSTGRCNHLNKLWTSKDENRMRQTCEHQKIKIACDRQRWPCSPLHEFLYKWCGRVLSWLVARFWRLWLLWLWSLTAIDTWFKNLPGLSEVPSLPLSPSRWFTNTWSSFPFAINNYYRELLRSQAITFMASWVTVVDLTLMHALPGPATT